eukprot:SAG11_NODE_192_length_12931_cov_5.747682_4_plen_211_part_00
MCIGAQSCQDSFSGRSGGHIFVGLWYPGIKSVPHGMRAMLVTILFSTTGVLTVFSPRRAGTHRAGEEDLVGRIEPDQESDADPDPGVDSGHAPTAPSQLSLAALPPQSIVTVHGMSVTVKDLDAALKAYGVPEEEIKCFKRKPDREAKAKEFVLAAGHSFTTNKNKDAVPFAALAPKTRSRHYANWQDKDFSRPAQTFVGRLGPKVRAPS